MKKYHSYINEALGFLSKNQIYAAAELRASAICPGINGAALFYTHPREKGLFVAFLIFGLPDGAKAQRYDVHIRGARSQGRQRSGLYIGNDVEEIIRMPEICGNGGFAVSLFYTEELTRQSVLGKTVSIFHKDNLQRSECDVLACGLILPT